MSTVNVMVDLETLGTGPDAKVISIGAVIFDVEKELGDSFYQEISWEVSSGTMDVGTIKFWMDQSSKGNTPPMSSVAPEWQVVSDFRTWLKDIKGSNDLTIWANGTDFDIPKLDRLLTLNNYLHLWKYNSVRDYRTVAKLFETYGEKPLRFGHHNALADAKWQATHLLSIARDLKEVVNVIL